MTMAQADCQISHHLSPVSGVMVPEEDAGQRLDVWLTRKYPYLSRAQLQKSIHEGRVLVAGKPGKPGHVLRTGERVNVAGDVEHPPPQPEGGLVCVSADLATAVVVLHEDEALMVVNKPRGLTVHPGAGTRQATLTHILQARGQQLSTLGGPDRPGIVHRLDKETSGVLLIAKTDAAHLHLSQQFKDRTIHKQYLALVNGTPKEPAGFIELSVGRHPVQRKKMSVHATSSKMASTEFQVCESFDQFALLKVVIHTGRTHQIRVHLSHLGHPVVGDMVYGGGKRRALSAATNMGTPALLQAIKELTGQALHAQSITFIHPITQRQQTAEALLPHDMLHILNHLREPLP